MPAKEKKEENQKPPSRSGVGIDNRDASAKRYESLEPENYTRHVHGDREGEFQQGGKSKPDLPLETGAPMPDVRFRKDAKKADESAGEQYGGRTAFSHPGDRDISGAARKKPPRTIPPRQGE
jgi:hypothetical protein